MPAVTNAVAFGSIMHAGMVLFGKACPCTMPAGRPPGPGPFQFLARTRAFTCASAGTLIVVAPQLPPQVAGSGTFCSLLCVPPINLRPSLVYNDEVLFL